MGSQSTLCFLLLNRLAHKVDIFFVPSIFFYRPSLSRNTTCYWQRTLSLFASSTPLRNTVLLCTDIRKSVGPFHDYRPSMRLRGFHPQYFRCPNPSPVLSLDVSSDGKRAISCGKDCTVKYWDLENRRCGGLSLIFFFVCLWLRVRLGRLAWVD